MGAQRQILRMLEDLRKANPAPAHTSTTAVHEVPSPATGLTESVIKTEAEVKEKLSDGLASEGGLSACGGGSTTVEDSEGKAKPGRKPKGKKGRGK